MLTLTPSDSKFKAEILIGKIYFKVSVTYTIIKNKSTRLTTAALHPIHTNLIPLFWGRVRTGPPNQTDV